MLGRGACLALAITGCSATVVIPPVARVDAPVGRLAGPPPALRAGVATRPDVPAPPDPPAAHSHAH